MGDQLIEPMGVVFEGLAQACLCRYDSFTEKIRGGQGSQRASPSESFWQPLDCLILSEGSALPWLVFTDLCPKLHSEESICNGSHL